MANDDPRIPLNNCEVVYFMVRRFLFLMLVVGSRKSDIFGILYAAYNLILRDKTCDSLFTSGLRCGNIRVTFQLKIDKISK